MSNSGNSGGIIIENEQNNDDLNSGGNSSKLSASKLFIILIVVLLIIGGGAYGSLSFIKSHIMIGNHQEGEKYKAQKSYTFAPSDIGRYTPPPPIEVKEEVAVKEEAPPVIIEKPAPIQPTPAPPEPVDNKPSLQDRRLSSGIQGYSSRNSSSTDSDDEAEEIPSRQVKMLQSIDYTLIKGTIIPCTMETNVISEQDGFTSCIINQDIYSGNARILLIEKGTRVTGQYRGSVKNGDRRLQIIWDRLITPYDIVVQIVSPSTGRLGASGITGKVDNRWGERIGSALLVSMISDVFKIAGEKSKSKSAQVIVDSKTADTSQDLAKDILKKNIDLSPIIYIREGEMINIYVADDIDLSSVYNVR